MSNTILLGESPVTFEMVHAVAHGAPAKLAQSARKRVEAARHLVETLAAGDTPVYGVTTGFGALAEIKVPRHQLKQLQRNLILSHAAGVGRPLSRPETRAMMFLRAQTLSEGNSGCRAEIIDLVLEMLNRGVHPEIPEKGSVGASGDLAPLAHIALTMIGEGVAEYEGQVLPALEAMTRAGLSPIVLEAKEGLSLVNGTQAMSAVGTLALMQAEALCRLADIAGAMTLEGLAGLASAFDDRIQRLRPHPGQRQSAENLRRLLVGSDTNRPANGETRVQDPYSLRCMPQVHGATRDAIKYARDVFTREINSATDNPLVFPEDGDIVSGGNFHGQPLAMALDFAAIAMAEIGNISERRVEQLVNPALSGLPPFLVPESGIHSGYMMAQVTAASLVNENKLFANPASTDSIPGSASREDHVSMGMTSARKLRELVLNVQSILAVEVLCACQAIDLRAPKSLGEGTRAAHKVVRNVIPHLDGDRLLAKDMQLTLELEQREEIQQAVEAALGSLH